jgi:hypothetical protein
VVSRVQKETELNCVPHLTCIGASKGEVLDIAPPLLGQGIRPHRGAARLIRPTGPSEVRTPLPKASRTLSDLVKG